MRWGVGSSPNNPTDYWNRQALSPAQNPNGLNARAMYAYNSSAVTQPSWNTWQLSNVPDTHDIWFQTKGTTRASFDQTLATFPATRTGKVYLHHWNEPEDNMTAATYISRVSDLFAAIDAAGLSYVVKAEELNGYKLRPVANFDSSGYVHPDCEHIGWSLFATAGGAKIVGGHVVAQVDAQTQTDQVVTFMNANAPGVPWSGVAWGFSIPDAYWSDSVSHTNRLSWAQQCASSLQAAGCKELMWYDFYQSATIGDYQLATDSALLSWWQSATAFQIGT